MTRDKILIVAASNLIEPLQKIKRSRFIFLNPPAVTDERIDLFRDVKMAIVIMNNRFMVRTLKSRRLTRTLLCEASQHYSFPKAYLMPYDKTLTDPDKSEFLSYFVSSELGLSNNCASSRHEVMFNGKEKP